MEEESTSTFESKKKWMAVGLTVLLAGLLTVWGIYGVGEYGMALFVLTPIFLGIAPVIIYGIKKSVTYNQALQLGFLSLFGYVLGLMVFAIEGLICIVMMLPLGCLLTWLGIALGYAIVRKSSKNASAAMWMLLIAIPITSYLEKDSELPLHKVITSIEIEASPQTVWENLIEFPVMDEPEEFIFKTGIAYPIDSNIEGTGVGAVRYCNFTTGSFVEPITIWDEPNLLQFDVLEQPAPMKEISFWDISAPHLNDYFMSKKGQFKLIELPNGNTLLEGITWYEHRIKPAIYWKLWSDQIIHKIHHRVLTHIKKTAEN